MRFELQIFSNYTFEVSSLLTDYSCALQLVQHSQTISTSPDDSTPQSAVRPANTPVPVGGVLNAHNDFGIVPVNSFSKNSATTSFSNQWGESIIELRETKIRKTMNMRALLTYLGLSPKIILWAQCLSLNFHILELIGDQLNCQSKERLFQKADLY